MNLVERADTRETCPLVVVPRFRAVGGIFPHGPLLLCYALDGSRTLMSEMYKPRRVKLFKVTMHEDAPVRFYDDEGEEYIMEDEDEEWTAEVVLVAKGPVDARIKAERYNEGEVIAVERYFDLRDKRYFERVMGRSLDVIEEVIDDP